MKKLSHEDVEKSWTESQDIPLYNCIIAFGNLQGGHKILHGFTPHHPKNKKTKNKTLGYDSLDTPCSDISIEQIVYIITYVYLSIPIVKLEGWGGVVLSKVQRVSAE